MRSRSVRVARRLWGYLISFPAERRVATGTRRMDACRERFLAHLKARSNPSFFLQGAERQVLVDVLRRDHADLQAPTLG